MRKNQFSNVIREHGWDPGPIIVDGRWHSFDTIKRKDKTGRYKVFSSGDFLAGCIWDWKSGLITTWNSGNGAGSGLSEAEKRKIDAAIEQSKKDAQRRAQYAEVRAKKLWDRSKPADPNHPYLLKKNIQPNGARQLNKSLIIPVMTDGKIKSIQFISGDGSKRFLSGGRVAGGSWTIPGNKQRVMTEGYATAESIHEATGATVRIAFNAGNLPNVAGPGWIIAGDNDQFTYDRHGDPWNPGCEKAPGGGMGT